MFKDIRSLVKHSGIYSIGNILSRSIGIILIPVYTSVITVAEFGVYAIFEAVIFFSESIFHFGLPNALFKWLNKDEFKNNSKDILFTTLLSMFLVSLILILPVYSFKNNISYIFAGNSELQYSILVSAMIVGIKLINRISLSFIRFKEKSIFFVIVNACSIYSFLICNFLQCLKM